VKNVLMVGEKCSEGEEVTIKSVDPIRESDQIVKVQISSFLSRYYG